MRSGAVGGAMMVLAIATVILLLGTWLLVILGAGE